jgi:pilus assembly protein Flp/PilA
MTRVTAPQRNENMKHIISNPMISSIAQGRLVRRARDLAADRRGAGLVEYIILVGAVALASAAAYGEFSKKVGDKINGLGDKVGQIAN